MGEPERMRLPPRVWPDLADEARLVRMAVAVGDDELAESAVAKANRRTELSPDVPSLAAIAAHASALRNDDVEELTHAVSLFKQSPRQFALASAWEDLGLAQQRQKAAESGIDALTQALVVFARAGATRDAARIRGSLRALGIRRRVATTEKPTAGWAAMTKSELAVAELVANGHTNREIADRLFVSPHTVNTHLRHVFAKLQVKSRVDLTRLATSRRSLAARAADRHAGTAGSTRANSRSQHRPAGWPSLAPGHGFGRRPARTRAWRLLVAAQGALSLTEKTSLAHVRRSRTCAPTISPYPASPTSQELKNGKARRSDHGSTHRDRPRHGRRVRQEGREGGCCGAP
jgi:DNA-binding CsgD family transcriptional regulator